MTPSLPISGPVDAIVGSSNPTQPVSAEDHNIKLLFERTKGTLFRVEGDQNTTQRLVVVQGWRQKMHYWWNRRTIEAQVKEVISTTLKAIQDKATTYQPAQIKTLFDPKSKTGIGRLSAELVDRTLEPTRVLLGIVRVHLGSNDDTFYLDIEKEVEDNLKSVPVFEVNDQENPHVAQHLVMLASRKKGELLTVDNEGRLVKVTDLKAYKQNRVDEEKKVRRAITATLHSLNQKLNPADRIHQLVIHHLFAKDSPLLRMHQAVYDRMGIKKQIVDGKEVSYPKGEAPTLENSTLERMLVTEFKSDFLDAKADFIDKKATYENDPERRSNLFGYKHSLLRWMKSETLLMQRLGIDLKSPGSGSGGTRVGIGRMGKELVVIKPGDEGPYGVNNPRWYARFKRFFATRECIRGNDEPLAEEDSYIFSHNLKLDIVPPTYRDHITSKTFHGQEIKLCSIQAFVSGCEELGSYANLNWKNMSRSFLRWVYGREEKKTELLRILPQEGMQKVAVHNFLTEDTDGHFGNVLVKRLTPEEQNFDSSQINFDRFFTDGYNQDVLNSFFSFESIESSPDKIALIKHDGGLSFPHSHPDAYLALRYKHLIEVLPHYDQALSPSLSQSLQMMDEPLQVMDEPQGNSASHFTLMLIKKGKRDLLNILSPEIQRQFFGSEAVFDDANRRLMEYRNIPFDNWVKAIISNDTHVEIVNRQKLLAELLDVEQVTAANRKEKKAYFKYHLERIHENIRMRKESFEVLKNHLKNDDDSKPNLRALLSVRSAKDFRRALNATTSATHAQ